MCVCNLVQSTSGAQRAAATAEGRIHNCYHINSSRASLKDKLSLTFCRPAAGAQDAFTYMRDTTEWARGEEISFLWSALIYSWLVCDSRMCFWRGTTTAACGGSYPRYQCEAWWICVICYFRLKHLNQGFTLVQGFFRVAQQLKEAEIVILRWAQTIWWKGQNVIWNLAYRGTL